MLLVDRSSIKSAPRNPNAKGEAPILAEPDLEFLLQQREEGSERIAFQDFAHAEELGWEEKVFPRRARSHPPRARDEAGTT